MSENEDHPAKKQKTISNEPEIIPPITPLDAPSLNEEADVNLIQNFIGIPNNEKQKNKVVTSEALTPIPDPSLISLPTSASASPSVLPLPSSLTSRWYGSQVIVAPNGERLGYIGGDCVDDENYQMLDEDSIDEIPIMNPSMKPKQDIKKIFGALGIRAILSVCDGEETPRHKWVSFAHFDSQDEFDFDIIALFHQILPFINQNKGHLLIKSGRGNGRAPTLWIMYLMHQYRVSLKDAFSIVKTAHPSTKPNTGFFEKLMLFECEVFGLQDDSHCSMTLAEYRKSSLKKWIQ